MPGAATAQLLNYANVVDVDLDATNDVNFADVEDYGHRVVVRVAQKHLNAYLQWTRGASAARPSAALNSRYEARFKAAVEAALALSYVDIDGVTGGLHYGSDNLSENPDPRIRKDDAISANDIPLGFVLYKLYGASNATTLDKIYNLEDAYDMLSNETVATAIVESFKASVGGAVDTMFRDLLAADPHRFFDSAGIPAAGIFEAKTDASHHGTWRITNDDTLEVKVKLMFKSSVTRRGVAGREHLLSETYTNTQENQQTVIAPNDYFYVRLQLKADSTIIPALEGSGSGSGTGSA
jgi:hypothetical protein